MHADELGKLWDLHQKGALTDSEYAAAKARLLGPPVDETDGATVDPAVEPTPDESLDDLDADSVADASIAAEEPTESNMSWLLIGGVVLAVLAVAGCFIGLMESLPTTVKFAVMALFVVITVLGGIIKWLRG